MPLSPADLNDIDFFDAPELRADGTLATPYRTITGLVSITAVTSRIVVPATELLTLNRDLPVEVGDRVVISGASGGNGTYKIVAIVDEQRFDVTPAPSANGVGGSAAFYYPAGATKIGIDPTGRSNFTGNTLQDALTQIDVAISASGVSSYDFLLENEPPAPSTTYTTTFTGNFITQERWRRLDTTLIRTIDYTYSSGRVVTEVRKVYAADGTTIDAQLTIAYTYTGNVVSSATRTRNI